CIATYNKILTGYGLPHFTKCTKIWHGQTSEGKRTSTFSDGAVIQELHITSNISVGKGNEDAYLKALSMLPYRNMVPRLHGNGKTTDWLTKKCKGSDLIYPSV